MDKLLKFLAKHGVDARATEDGKISAMHIYCINGVASEEWETIEPTTLAVLDWLGY